MVQSAAAHPRRECLRVCEDQGMFTPADRCTGARRMRTDEEGEGGRVAGYAGPVWEAKFK